MFVLEYSAVMYVYHAVIDTTWASELISSVSHLLLFILCIPCRLDYSSRRISKKSFKHATGYISLSIWGSKQYNLLFLIEFRGVKINDH